MVEPSAPHHLEDSWTEDPEFVRLYDLENAGMWDFDFYRELAEELRAGRVADIGCGTGVLAVELARGGIEVVGVDPAAAMIEAARARVAEAGLSESVQLIRGTAAALAPSSSDLAVMVGHVAQYFLHREQWDEVLSQAWEALRPGGHLAFESRNPEAMHLDAWDAESTRATQPHPDGGEFTSWLEVAGVEHDDADGDLITALGHNVYPDGRHVIAEEPLRYRPLHVLSESLESAGFTVAEIWGDWDRSPVQEESPELILLARKP